jgi:hypothetical protein
MKRVILTVLLLAAPPAFAQKAPPDTAAQAPMPAPTNLGNPQAQSNMAQQPPSARTSPGAVDAPSVPTPELGQKSTPVTR